LKTSSQNAESKPVARPDCSYGGVVVNAHGLVLLREPKNHFDGYVWTFPKGRAEPGETEEEVARREVREETGVEARIVERIPGEFIGGTGRTIFFLMAVEKETGELDGETQSIAWVDRHEAIERIKQTTNRLGRERDLKVLQAALATLG
jgi:ADP-ribose pyrophosphatase YjhB (NUDIX family)